VLLCKTGSQHDCVSAITLWEIGSSYMCAVMQHQSTAALVRAEKLAHCSVLLCKTGSQHDCVTAITPREICSSYRCAVMQHQSSTGQGRIASLLFSVALQNRLTACLCHCNYIYGDLLFLQFCSDATPKHCSTGQGRIASPFFSAAL